MTPIPLTRLHTSRVYLLLRGGGGSQSRHHSACATDEKEQFEVTSSRRHYPTEPATSCRVSSARFDVDFRQVIIDVSLFSCLVERSGRGCRPQRVDFRQNLLTRCTLASTASPNDPITPALARGHLPLNGQHPQQAHHCGGGVMTPNKRGYYHFYYLFNLLFFILC